MNNNLPKTIPIFPLENILFLPDVNLPLYIFEPRYLNMTSEAIKEGTLIGMVQLIDNKDNNFKETFKIGCAGKIVFYEKTEDEKFLIILKGISRFKIKKELSLKNGYRRIIPDWRFFKDDIKNKAIDNKLKEELIQNVGNYVKTLNLNFFKKQLNKIPTNEIIQIVARELAFSKIENQSIIECENSPKRIELLIKFLQNLSIADKSNAVH